MKLHVGAFEKDRCVCLCCFLGCIWQLLLLTLLALVWFDPHQHCLFGCVHCINGFATGCRSPVLVRVLVPHPVHSEHPLHTPLLRRTCDAAILAQPHWPHQPGSILPICNIFLCNDLLRLGTGAVNAVGMQCV